MKADLFRDDDDRQETLREIRELLNCRRLIAKIADNKGFAAYRVVDVASGIPVMPSTDELVQAQDVLHRLTACHAHLYEQRRRDDEDWPLNPEALTDPDRPSRIMNGPLFRKAS